MPENKKNKQKPVVPNQAGGHERKIPEIPIGNRTRLNEGVGDKFYGIITQKIEDPDFQIFDENFDWASIESEKFENLIVDILKKEFGTNGGEVEFTKDSQGGWINAVAFDPDPIRGGKIVIKAKKHEDNVGVPAISDLFGKVQNEGANKGILFTTSDYGQEAYDFVKNKPLTLLGSKHLENLFKKHGYTAKLELGKNSK